MSDSTAAVFAFAAFLTCPPASCSPRACADPRSNGAQALDDAARGWFRPGRARAMRPRTLRRCRSRTGADVADRWRAAPRVFRPSAIGRPGLQPRECARRRRSAANDSRHPRREYRIFYDQVLEKASAIPGVERAALTSVLPLSSDSDMNFSIEGRPAPSAGLNAGWLRTLGKCRLLRRDGHDAAARTATPRARPLRPSS